MALKVRRLHRNGHYIVPLPVDHLLLCPELAQADVILAGAILLLVMSFWHSGCTLPTDETTLAQIAKCNTARWLRIREKAMAAVNRLTPELVGEYNYLMAAVKERSERAKRASSAAVAAKAARRFKQVADPPQGEAKTHVARAPIDTLKKPLLASVRHGKHPVKKVPEPATGGPGFQDSTRG